jgi:hypothetical protein
MHRSAPRTALDYSSITAHCSHAVHLCSCRFSDIGTGDWWDVSCAILVTVATPAGKCLISMTCVGAFCQLAAACRAHTMSRSHMYVGHDAGDPKGRRPVAAAFAPLAFALGRFTYIPGLLLLVGMWAASFYNAMLLVRRCSNDCC